MTAIRLVRTSDPVYRFKQGARIPSGVTVDGVMEEYGRIVEEQGHATAKEAAETVLSAPKQFPNLRAFAPGSAREALRLCMEDGIRDAWASVVLVETIQAQSGGSREIEVRFLHAVPVEGVPGLCYEPVEVIRDDPEQKAYLVRKLREDARAFSQKLENVLAELEAIL